MHTKRRSLPHCVMQQDTEGNKKLVHTGPRAECEEIVDAMMGLVGAGTTLWVRPVLILAEPDRAVDPAADQFLPPSA